MGVFTKTPRRNNPAQLGTWQQDGPKLDLQTITLADLYPGLASIDTFPMFRAEAQTVPGVMAIQNLLTASIAGLNMQAVNSTGDLVPAQPAWITRADYASQNPWLRLGQTVKDILYEGISCWSIDAKDANGYPLSMSHVPIAPDRWDYTGRYWTYAENGQGVVIDGVIQPWSSVVIFEPLFEGILNIGSRTLRSAVAIERTILARSRTAMPTQALKNLGTGDTEPSAPELLDYLKQYTAARQSDTGTTVYIPAGFDLVRLQDSPNNWLLEARSSVIADLSKLTGVPSGLIEGAQFGSLNYTTEIGQLARYSDFNIRTYTDPITARLSMGDVTPRGTSVRFDFSPLQSEAPSPLTDKGTPAPINPAGKEPANA